MKGNDKDRGKARELLIRTATGVIFVAVTLVMTMLSRVSFLALLAVAGIWCSVEFWRIARTATLKALGVLYIALCMVAMWFFPTMGGGMSVVPEGTWDSRIVPAFLMVVWANDVFAYLVGITLGRHKMSPALSPHKTWEGFAGGVVGAMLASGVIGSLWIGEVWRIWIPFGLFVALAAVGGDLAESRFKRAAGVKDSGRLLPGHGGLLDRFDATLGAIPVAFLFFLLTHLSK
ncbi:MAG: phosphatidate cytidylyltransferase [Alistipes sp.]|jgi:phosphatidate cytidylyltransferase|nr:phosphatidate cytidylyltransferase [Alistipes sp.]